MTDLERADTFTVYRDMGDIVNPKPGESSSSTNRFMFFPFGGGRQNNHHEKPENTTQRHEGVYGSAVSFAGISNKSTVTPSNNDESSPQTNIEEEDGILDEETWNWSALIARVFAFFLLFLIIICIGLEAITRRFLILAAIICVLLVIVIIGTYIDLREKCCWWICPRPRHLSENPIENSSSSASVSNPLVTSSETKTSKIQITDRFANR